MPQRLYLLLHPVSWWLVCSPNDKAYKMHFVSSLNALWTCNFLIFQIYNPTKVRSEECRHFSCNDKYHIMWISGIKREMLFSEIFSSTLSTRKKVFPGNKYFISLLLRLGAFLGMIWRWRIVQNRATGFPGKGKQHRFVVCSKPESRPTTSPPFNTAFLYFHHHHSHPECFIA